ncbi:endo-1,4-beta-xylanase [Streptomyces sp. NPDC048425]|uniref:endo-1,4-beta-xylanase n=1 Tax=Streptomyces sp. NPDC048425 TaxID=3365548 RepID=UPI00372137E2
MGAPASPLRGVPAAAAEQGSPHDLAVAHRKYFGSATDNPELPNTAYAATLGSQSGQITPGNSTKWDTTEPQQGQFTFAKGDVFTGYARDHGQTVLGHTLVRHGQLHGWVGAGKTVWDHTDKFSWVLSAVPGQDAASLHDENVRPKAAYATVRSAPGGDDEGSGEPGALKAQYRNSDSAPGDNQTKPALQLVNTGGTTAVDLSTVKVRHGSAAGAKRPPAAHGATGPRSAAPASPTGWPP